MITVTFLLVVPIDYDLFSFTSVFNFPCPLPPFIYESRPQTLFDLDYQFTQSLSFSLFRFRIPFNGLVVRTDVYLTSVNPYLRFSKVG